MLANCDPTFSLLLAALRWPDRLNDLDARSGHSAHIDWRRFIMLANRHRVGPLVLRAILSGAMEIPETHSRDLAKLPRTAIFAEMRIADEFVRLRRLLIANAVDPILLKGPGLSLRAFGELGLRTYRDLDLFVGEEAAGPSCALLISAGYEILEPCDEIVREDFRSWRKDHKDALFRQAETGFLVELHWRLFDNRSLMAERDLPAPVQLGLPPLETALVLPLEAELPYLCIHGALHGWSRLRWLADINALISTAPEQLLLSCAASTPAVAQALILCRELLGTTLPHAVGKLLDRSVRARWLARLAWSEILRSGTEELEAIQFATTVKNLSHYAILGGAAQLIEELRFDLNAQPRLTDGPPRKARFADWMTRHLLSR